ncbi:hypothetical protein, partial [Novosphingobium sp.]|uniref:hypothetical protein n=1 Tax=Novosphingobium sp. TaxID=1874826 RepID=UPI003FA57B6D
MPSLLRFVGPRFPPAAFQLAILALFFLKLRLPLGLGAPELNPIGLGYTRLVRPHLRLARLPQIDDVGHDCSRGSAGRETVERVAGIEPASQAWK